MTIYLLSTSEYLRQKQTYLRLYVYTLAYSFTELEVQTENL